MPSILDFYNRQKYAVDRIVDTTFFRLIEDNTGVLNRIMPVQSYLDTMLLLMKLNRSKPTIASLVGDEQELPNQRARVTLTEELLGEARIGKQHIFTNNDFKAMKKLEEALQRANATALQEELERVFFGIAADLVPSVIEKLTLLTVEVLTTGACNFTDPLTDVRMVLSYPNVVTSGGNQLMFTSNPSGSDDWGAPTTANGLGQIESHSVAWYNNFGSFPRMVALRWSLLRDLANQRSTKRAYGSVVGYVADGANADAALDAMYLKDEQVMDLIRDRTRGAEVILLDAMYSEEQANGSATDKYFLDDKRYMFCEENNVERAFVPTPERDFAPGIYVRARQLDDAPRKERIAGVGCGIPAIVDDRKLAARRVRV